jgi:murein DD-endopeptidase
VLGPGLRAVVYFWTPLPASAPAPHSLVHHIDLSVPDGSGRRDVQVQSPAVDVSRTPPVVIDAPLAGGPWVAIYSPLLVGGHRTALYTLGGRARIPGRFAIDWIRAPREPSGKPVDAAAVRSSDTGFGADVLAVGDARVAIAVDDMPDLPPGSRVPSQPVPLERASGNYVALDLGGGRVAFYEHLRQGSVKVRAGDRVTRGQVIAQLGSSGSTSIGAHLHFHVADADHSLAAEGMPFVFRQFEHLGSYASLDGLLAGVPWSVAAPESAGVRRLEHPGAVAVVRF